MEQNKIFSINSYSPHTTIKELIQIYEGKVENGLVVFDNDFAKGKFKCVDYDNQMVAIINNIQYKKKTQFDFSSRETDKEWITLLFNSQSCIIILNNTTRREAAYNNHGSFMEFKNETVGWQPAPDKNNPVKTIVMFIAVKWFDEIGMTSDGATQLKNVLKAEEPVKLVQIGKNTVRILEEIFNMIDDMDNHPLLNKKLESYLWALATDTLYHCFNRLEDKQKQTTLSVSEQIKTQIMAAKDEMLRDFSKESLDLDYLAKFAGMNRTKFQEAFKAIFNVSFHKYYQEARFNEALRLLEFEHYTTTSVAAAVGYKNVGYFIKEFQKRFGVTPNEYRTKNTK